MTLSVFAELGLDPLLCDQLQGLGFNTPTPIQTQAIPEVLKGQDLLAAAQTGTGKTAAFGLPILHMLLKGAALEKPKRGPSPVRALVLTPTRELAAQVAENLREYSQGLPVRTAVVFGGVSINPQMMKLRGGVDILVATPGRLLDLIQQNALTLNQVQHLVLDEADRMLDMGFIRDIRKIMAMLPKKRQSLLFSATFADNIRVLARELLHNPVQIEVAVQNSTADTIRQLVHPVDRVRKRELLSYLIGSQQWQQVLIFTRTKHVANRLAEFLQEDGIKAAAIHGNKSQGARTKALADFKAGNIRALVATDIAARGIDINQLPHVVNYELPNVPEDYVHRIGRTGRAQNNGVAVSLVCIDENPFLANIERLIKQKIDKQAIVGFEPDPSIKAEPIVLGGGRQQNGRGRSSSPGRGAPRSQPSNAPSRRPRARA